MSALAEEAPPVQGRPTLGVCPRCRTVVLRAPLRGSGLVVVLDRGEVIPRMPCPTCRSARLRDWDVRCWRCGDTGYVGDEMVGFGAAIGEDGFATPLDLARLTVEYGNLVHAIVDPEFEGTAIHRAHRCHARATAN